MRQLHQEASPVERGQAQDHPRISSTTATTTGSAADAVARHRGSPARRALDVLAYHLLTTGVAARRGYGEDSIYWHAAKGRYVGAISLGYGPAGKRIRSRSPVRRRPRTSVVIYTSGGTRPDGQTEGRSHWAGH